MIGKSVGGFSFGCALARAVWDFRSSIWVLAWYACIDRTMNAILDVMLVVEVFEVLYLCMGFFLIWRILLLIDFKVRRSEGWSSVDVHEVKYFH